MNRGCAEREHERAGEYCARRSTAYPTRKAPARLLPHGTRLATASGLQQGLQAGNAGGPRAPGPGRPGGLRVRFTSSSKFNFELESPRHCQWQATSNLNLTPARRGPGPASPGDSDFGLWSFRFPPVLVRTGRRLPVQALGERGVLVTVTGYPRGGAPGPG